MHRRHTRRVIHSDAGKSQSNVEPRAHGCVLATDGGAYSRLRRMQSARPRGAGRSALGRDGRTCRADGGASRRSTTCIRRSECPRVPQPAPESPPYCAAPCVTTHMTTRGGTAAGRGAQVGGGVVIVGEAAQLAVSVEGGPTTARRSVAQENRSSARNRRKYLAGALAEIEVGAFEALESRAPETGLCILLLAKAAAFPSGAQNEEH